MAEKIVLNVPTTEKRVRELKGGSEVYVTGTVYNMRQSLFKLVDMANRGEKIPRALLAGLKDGAIHYSGPLLDSKKEKIIANSSLNVRALPFPLIEKAIRDWGVRIVIAKDAWRESQKTIDLMKECDVAYLCTAVGTGAWYAYPMIKRIKNTFLPEMGEIHACHELEVENFGPTWVGTDAHGNSLFEDAKKKLEENRKKIYEEQGWPLTPGQR